MSRSSNEIIDKTIHGVPVSQNAFKRAICEALSTMTDGAGKAKDILPFLGPEWDTPHGRKILAKTLINLTANRTLQRDPEHRGVYVVSNRFRRLGVSVADANEQSILDSLRARGGFARWRDIMEERGLRAHGDELREVRERRQRQHYGTEQPGDELSTVYDVRNTTEYNQLKTLIAESQLIRQDYLVKGLYNLPIDELNKMTLRGAFAAVIIKATREELGKPDKRYVHRDAFFTSVGSVYQDARMALGLQRKDFAARPKVQAALLDLARKPMVKRDLDRYYHDTTAGKKAEMVAAGAPPEEVAAYMEDRSNSREGRQLPIDLLERFEMGGEGWEGGEAHVGVNAHLYAPVSFYETLAAELGIDPVAASRGFLQLDTRGEKLRPGHSVPDAQRLGELDAHREGIRDRGGITGEGQLLGFDDDDEPPEAGDED